MELLFDQTPRGSISVSTKTMTDLVARHLPRSVACTSLRFRRHDRLCLVLITDRRSRWNRWDDQQRAQAIVSDLKMLGVSMPRLQWVRTTSDEEMEELRRSPARLVERPLFWTLTAAAVLAPVMMTFHRSVVFWALCGAAWWVSHWLLRRGGLEKLKRLATTPPRRYFK